MTSACTLVYRSISGRRWPEVMILPIFYYQPYSKLRSMEDWDPTVSSVLAVSFAPSRALLYEARRLRGSER